MKNQYGYKDVDLKILAKYGYTANNSLEEASKELDIILYNKVYGEQSINIPNFFEGEMVKPLKKKSKTALVLLTLESCLSVDNKRVRDEIINAVLSKKVLSSGGIGIDPNAYGPIFDLIHSHKDVETMSTYMTNLQDNKLGLNIVISRLKKLDIPGIFSGKMSDSQLVDYAIALAKLKDTGVIKDPDATQLVQKFMAAVTKVPSSLKGKPDFYKYVLPLIPHDKFIEVVKENGNRKGGWHVLNDIVKHSTNWKDAGTKDLLSKIIDQRVVHQAFTSTSQPGPALGEVLKELETSKLNVPVFNAMIEAREKFERTKPSDAQRLSAGYDAALSAIFKHQKSAQAIYNAAKDDPKLLKKLLGYHPIKKRDKQVSMAFAIFDQLSAPEKLKFLENKIVNPLQILADFKVLTKEQATWELPDANFIEYAAKVQRHTLSPEAKEILIERLLSRIDHKHTNFFIAPGAPFGEVPATLPADLAILNNPNLNLEVFKALIVIRDDARIEGNKANCEAVLLHILQDPQTATKLYNDYKGTHNRGKLKKLLSNDPVDGKSVAYYIYKGLSGAERAEFLGNKLVNPESILQDMAKAGATKAEYNTFLDVHLAAIKDVKEYTKPYSNSKDTVQAFYKLPLQVDGKAMEVNSTLDLILKLDNERHAYLEEFTRGFVGSLPKKYTAVEFAEELDKITEAIRIHASNVNFDIEPKKYHDHIMAFYNTIMLNPKGVELAKGAFTYIPDQPALDYEQKYIIDPAGDIVYTSDSVLDRIGTFYNEITRKPQEPELTEYGKEHFVYMLATCKQADRTGIFAMLGAKDLKEVLESLRDNEHISLDVKLAVLTDALTSGRDIPIATAMEVASELKIPEDFVLPNNSSYAKRLVETNLVEAYYKQNDGSSLTQKITKRDNYSGILNLVSVTDNSNIKVESLKKFIESSKDNKAVFTAFATAMLNGTDALYIIDTLEALDSQQAIDIIDIMVTSKDVDKQKSNKILRAIATQQPDLVYHLAKADIETSQKAQVLLGFADIGEDGYARGVGSSYTNITRFLKAQKGFSIINLEDAASIRNAFDINDPKFMDIFIQHTLLAATDIDKSIALFEVGSALFEVGPNGLTNPAAQGKFIVEYYNTLKQENPKFAKGLLSSKLGEILVSSYKLKPTNLASLAEAVFDVQGDKSDEQFITDISNALAKDVSEDDRRAFVDKVVDLLLIQISDEPNIDEAKYINNNLNWMIKERSLAKNKEYISIVAMGDEASGKTAIMSVLTDMLSSDAKATAMLLIESMLETEEMREMLTDNMGAVIAAMGHEEIKQFNEAITTSAGMTSDDKKTMRMLLFAGLIALEEFDAIALTATPQHMKISEISIDNAVAILKADILKEDLTKILNAMLSENKLDDLKALLAACKDSPELISLIATIREEANDPNLIEALADKVSNDPNNTTTYNDIYVLHSIQGLKADGLDAVTAAGLLLKEHHDAKGNPAYQKAIEEYYTKYVGQSKQVVFTRVDGQQSDLDKALSSIAHTDPKVLTKFFDLSPAVTDDQAQAPVDTSVLKPVNLLLFDFKFLAQLNDAYEEHKNPAKHEKKGIMEQLLEYLAELFSLAASEKDVQAFAKTFESVLSKELTFQQDAAVGDRHPDSVKALQIDASMEAEKAPEFAKESFKKAAIVRKSLDPEGLRDRNGEGIGRF